MFHHLLELRRMVNEECNFIQPSPKDRMLIKMKCKLTEHWACGRTHFTMELKEKNARLYGISISLYPSEFHKPGLCTGR